MKLKKCRANVEATVNICQRLGFTVNNEIFVLTSTKELKYLGFLLNSETMTVTLYKEKMTKAKGSFYIIELTQVIGQLVAAFLAVNWVPLHHKELGNLKKITPKGKKENVDAISELSREA